MSTRVSSVFVLAVAVLWLVNGTLLGGMTSGGLGGRDGGTEILGSLSAELWAPLGQNFEPHVAEEQIISMVTKVRCLYPGLTFSRSRSQSR